MADTKPFLVPAETDVAADASIRARNCMVDIQNALKKWGCVIDPRVIINGTEGVKTTWAVVPLVERPNG